MSHLDVEYPESWRGASRQNYSRPSRGNASRIADTVALLEASTAPCCLTEHDARLLEEAVAINGGMDTPIGRAVAEKLSYAELRSAIPDDYVKLNSHVIFRVDGNPPFSRVLVHWDKFCVPGLHLSLHTPWGITLLGMKTGHEAAVYWRDGVAEVIKVESVAHLPETVAARREKADAKTKQSVRTASTKISPARGDTFRLAKESRVSPVHRLPDALEADSR